MFDVVTDYCLISNQDKLCIDHLRNIPLSLLPNDSVIFSEEVINILHLGSYVKLCPVMLVILGFKSTTKICKEESDDPLV
jgi:hypothetical protein